MATIDGTGGGRIFYGWWIVGGAVVGYFVAVGAGFASAAVFLTPVTEDLGWSRGEFTLATSGANALSGLAGVFIGPLVDRHGARPLMAIGAVALAGSLMLTSQVTELWQFVALQAFGVGMGLALVGPLTLNVTLSKWFVVRRGWAIALGSTGISFASMVVPLTLTRLVDSQGWRDGYLMLGIFVLIVSLPVAMLMRRTPEDYGLLPDGQRHDGVGTSLADVETVRLDRINSYTRHEAVRTRALWLLTLSFGFFGAAAFALLIHGIAFVTEAGFTRGEAAVAVAVAGAGNLLAKFVWGYMLARFHVRTLWASCFALLGAGVVLMLAADSAESLPLMFTGFFVWGLGFGGGVPLGEFIWARYFGRVHIGAVRSVGMPLGIFFGASGPLAASWLFDLTDAYAASWLAMLVLYALGALAVLVSR
ncbi:MAG: MFS transporter, partial [Chloroflexi bacterium]|nr:MFS transporter [Chloroflexota bacterium]